MICEKYKIKICTDPIHGWQSVIDEFCYHLPDGDGLVVNEQACFVATAPEKRIKFATDKKRIKITQKVAKMAVTLAAALRKEEELHKKLFDPVVEDVAKG
jgi:hypothetical protein